MRKLTLQWIAVVGLAFVSGSGVGAGASTKAVDPLVESYLILQERLAADSTAGVAAAAQKLAAEARRRAQGADKELLARVAVTAEAMKGSDLEALRIRFQELSRAMVAYLKASPKAGLATYYCPMKKANWVQKAGPVKNPYYGKAMLACGNPT